MTEALPVLRALVAVAATAVGGYIDFRTGLIPDKVTYSAAALGLLMLAASLDLGFILQGLSAAALVYAFGYLLYYFGQLGGGDVKLLVALTLLLPYSNSFGVPYSVMILLTASVLAVFVGFAYYGLKYALHVREKEFKPERVALGFALAVGAFFYAQFISSFDLFTPFGVAATYFVFLVAAFYTAFGEDMNNKLFSKKLTVSSIKEEDLGDVLALGLEDSELLKKLELKGKKVLDEEVVARLKKARAKTVWVYSNLPRFGSALFLATLIVLWNADWPKAFLGF